MKLFVVRLTTMALLITSSLSCLEEPNFEINLKALDEEMQKIDLETQSAEVNMQAVEHIISNSPLALKEIIKAYEKRHTFRGELPKAILLLGAPGVGKSTLARGIAVKAKLPCRFIQCSLIADQYKNSGTKNLERIFEPIFNSDREEIIILDEINALTDKHGNEYDNDKNMAMALWQIMDRLKNKKQFTLIIATANFNDNMPEPLKDRFATTMFNIPLPDNHMRMRIAQHYLDQARIHYDKTILKLIASNSRYSSGRFIEDVCKKIIFKAVFRSLDTNNRVTITKVDAQAAIFDVQKSMEVGGYTQHSEFYSRIKQLAGPAVPYLFPSIGLLLHIYQIIQTRESLSISRGGMAVSKR
jgi:SpoVK/Ycf46/Vps4 family AAA+-type ATPase